MYKFGQSSARRKGSRGFTLIELLVVLAILALLAGLVGPSVMKQFSGAKTKAAALQIRDLESALEMYKLDVGRYPTNDDGLEALVVQPPQVKGWNGPYLKKKELPLDPWKNAYEYRLPGSNGDFDIISLGADGSPGGEGEDADIDNS